MLQEVTNDVRMKLILQPLTGEELPFGNNVSMEGCADINPRGFFDVRIFDANAQSLENRTLKRCYETNKLENKRDYNCRILNVEQGSSSGFKSHLAHFPAQAQKKLKKFGPPKIPYISGNGTF